MKKMLFLLDFSRASHEALKYYLDLARALELEVSVLNVHDEYIKLEQKQETARSWWRKLSPALDKNRIMAALLQRLVKLSKGGNYDAIMLGDPYHIKIEENGSVLNIRLVRQLLNKAYCPIWMVPFKHRFQPLRNLMLREKDIGLYRHEVVCKMRDAWGSRVHLFKARSTTPSVAAYQLNRFDEGRRATNRRHALQEWLTFSNRNQIDICLRSVGKGSILEEAVQASLLNDRLHIPTLVFNRNSIRALRETPLEASTGLNRDGLLLTG